MKKINYVILLLTIISIPCFDILLNAQENESFVVIVNQSNPISEMTSSQVSKIFLKKVKVWDNGKEIKPIDLTDESPLRAKFSKKIHLKKVSAIESYWQQRIFAGRAVPPPRLNTEEEVIDYVKRNPTAIGYVSKNAKIADVKVLRLVSY